MTLVLLTWTPGPHDDHVYSRRSWTDDVVAPTLAGRPVRSTWGVGRHRHGIGPGSLAVLHRQGSHGRGILARGEVTSEVMVGERTRTPGRVTRYVAVTWTQAVPVDLRLDVADLELAVPQVAWRHVYSSGRTLPAVAAEALLAEWGAHVGHPGTLEAVRRAVAEAGDGRSRDT